MIYNKMIFGISLLFLTIFVACKSNNDPTNSGDNFSNTLGVGDAANQFLSSSKYSSVTIEVDYVTGFRPTPTALNNLKAFLEARLNKPGGITFIIDDAIRSPEKSPYTPQDAYDIEKEYRDTFTEGDNLAAYFIVLDGEFENENVLGFAYFNTSMALLGGTIQNNSDGFNQPSRETVESAVLQHEFGHILGLVDNGTPAVQDHKDEANGAHCDVESCLMYYAVQTSGFLNNLTGGSIPKLDAQCIQDLQANGGK